MHVTADAPAAAWFTPIRMLDVEIGAPIADIAPAASASGVYTRAWALVRLHGRPLGMVDVTLPGGALPAAALAGAIGDALGGVIAGHLRDDGLPVCAQLDARGVPADGTPRCVAERDAVVADGPLVSVIIATRDRAESLAACLNAIMALRYPRFEVIVVDNAPTTGATAALVAERRAADPRIRYAREDRPGLGRAHNCGVAHARGTIMAFTDDDVIVDPDWLGEIVRGFDARDVGCVAGMVVPWEIETPCQFWFETHSGFNKGFAPQRYDLRAHRPHDRLFPYRASMFGTGANMAFRAAALGAIGGFDPLLGPGTPAKNGEDLDVFFRVVAAGYQLVYRPSAFVRHVHRADYAALCSQFSSYGVGFTAYLTKIVVSDPRRLLGLLAATPAIVGFLRGTRRGGATTPEVKYPLALRRGEWVGRLYGPLAYLRSRWSARRDAAGGTCACDGGA